MILLREKSLNWAGGEPAVPESEAPAIIANVTRLIAELRDEGFETGTSCDLNWVAEIFARWHSKDGATRLSRNADPRYWPNDSRPDRTLAVMLSRDGVVSGTAVQRLHWIDGTLKSAMESRRFFYGDLVAAAPGGERCSVTAPLAEDIADVWVVYSCALHVEAPHGPNTAWRLARLAHALALLQWRWTYMTARITPRVQRYLLEKAYGFAGAEKGVWIDEGSGRQDPGVYLFAVPRRYMRQIAQRRDYGMGDTPLLDSAPLFAEVEG